MLQNFLNYTVRGRVQRNGATLLALSTVAMGGVEPGTMVIAARERGEPPLQDTYLHDLTRVFRPGDGRFPFLYGRTPCVKIDAATAAAAAHFNVGPEANAREGDPDRRINLVWRAYQCTAGTRVQGGPGSDDRPTSWEVGAIIKAWEDRGPASIAGVVVDTYDADGSRPPVPPLLRKFGGFIRYLLENFKPWLCLRKGGGKPSTPTHDHRGHGCQVRHLRHHSASSHCGPQLRGRIQLLRKTVSLSLMRRI